MASDQSRYQKEAAQVLSHHGKSFNFARAFLSKDHAVNGARLYAFCRRLDDIADDNPNPDIARAKLKAVDLQLLRQTTPEDWVGDFLELAEDTQMDIAVARQLLAGVLSDLDEVRFETKAQLIQYAYSVAGTVGLMMCDVFHVTNPKARPFAIDLGIAMQLTNIARDIQEDAENNRRYVPGDWVQNSHPCDIANPTKRLKPFLQEAAGRLLDLADVYYDSARDGLNYLPNRPRLSILVASSVYREIGVKLRRKQCKTWQGRVFVGFGRILRLAAQAFWAFGTDPSLRHTVTTHDLNLHSDIRCTYKLRVGVR